MTINTVARVGEWDALRTILAYTADYLAELRMNFHDRGGGAP
jgi:hypothetical protein